MVHLSDLSEAQILALAISSEEEDGHIYMDFAHLVEASYPETAKMFRAMAKEEDAHRRVLINCYKQRFGQHIPLIRRKDIKGFSEYKAPWRIQHGDIAALRAQAGLMEQQAARFYRNASQQAQDIDVRKLLGDLARVEDEHRRMAASLEEDYVTPEVSIKESEISRKYVLLRVVQPGLVGLMDGSVSTLAPVFAAAFATHDVFNAFQVGLAASVGAAISMGFAEALADDGRLSGRGSPILRGLLCGLMTFLGGIGHTLPFLIKEFHTATAVAFGVVCFELILISWIRYKYQEASFSSTLVQVLIGGSIVFAAGILIGCS